MSNRLAFAVLAVACISAAAGGGYLATRQNTIPVPTAAEAVTPPSAVPSTPAPTAQPAAAATPSPAPVASAAPAPVQETEAAIDPRSSQHSQTTSSIPATQPSQPSRPARTTDPRSAKNNAPVSV